MPPSNGQGRKQPVNATTEVNDEHDDSSSLPERLPMRRRWTDQFKDRRAGTATRRDVDGDVRLSDLARKGVGSGSSDTRNARVASKRKLWEQLPEADKQRQLENLARGREKSLATRARKGSKYKGYRIRHEDGTVETVTTTVEDLAALYGLNVPRLYRIFKHKGTIYNGWVSLGWQTNVDKSKPLGMLAPDGMTHSFESINEAARVTGVNIGTISKMANPASNTIKQSGGWEIISTNG